MPQFLRSSTRPRLGETTPIEPMIDEGSTWISSHAEAISRATWSRGTAGGGEAGIEPTCGRSVARLRGSGWKRAHHLTVASSPGAEVRAKPTPRCSPCLQLAARGDPHAFAEGPRVEGQAPGPAQSLPFPRAHRFPVAAEPTHRAIPPSPPSHLLLELLEPGVQQRRLRGRAAWRVDL
eukprot:scaffold187974_cov43-Tisochrysis_lutea.AAC.2